MSNFKDRFSYLVLENRVKAPKENSSLRGTGLSIGQQNMVWRDYYKTKSIYSHKIPIFSTAAMQYYLMPEVSRGGVIVPGSSEAYNRFVPESINTNQMIDKPELKTTLPPMDGIQGEINEVKVFTDIMNSPERIDLKEVINKFANSASKRRLKYLRSYLRLFSQIEDNCTDIVMYRGTLTDLDGSVKNTLYICAFVEDYYMITYNHTAIKEEDLRTSISTNVVYRAKSGNLYTDKFPLSTIGKKNNEQIQHEMLYSVVSSNNEGNICNNIQEDCYSLNNIRTLAGVI